MALFRIFSFSSFSVPNKMPYSSTTLFTQSTAVFRDYYSIRMADIESSQPTYFAFSSPLTVKFAPPLRCHTAAALFTAALAERKLSYFLPGSRLFTGLLRRTSLRCRPNFSLEGPLHQIQGVIPWYPFLSRLSVGFVGIFKEYRTGILRFHWVI